MDWKMARGSPEHKTTHSFWMFRRRRGWLVESTQCTLLSIKFGKPPTCNSHRACLFFYCFSGFRVKQCFVEKTLKTVKWPMVVALDLYWSDCIAEYGLRKAQTGLGQKGRNELGNERHAFHPCKLTWNVGMAWPWLFPKIVKYQGVTDSFFLHHA